RRLAVNRAESRRQNAKIPASVHSPPKKPFGHRAATNVSSADEQNRFHAAQGFKVNSEWQIVNPKSRMRSAHHRQTLDQIHGARQNRVADERLLRLRGVRRKSFVLIAVLDFCAD